MSRSRKQSLRQKLDEIHLLQMEASEPEKWLLLDEAVRIARRLDITPLGWLARAMLNAPGIRQLFVNYGGTITLESRSVNATLNPQLFAEY